MLPKEICIEQTLAQTTLLREIFTTSLFRNFV